MASQSLIINIPEIRCESREFCYFFPKVLQIRKVCLSLHRETIRREKSKPQKPQMIKQLEAVNTEEPKPKVNLRQEKFANFLIDVAKYVFAGVIITSLFNDMTDKTTLYLAGMFIVVISLTVGLVLTNKRKDK